MSKSAVAGGVPRLRHVTLGETQVFTYTVRFMVEGSTVASREARARKCREARSDSRRLVPNWPVDQPPTGGFALVVSKRAKLGFPDRWMLDSGASFHLVSRRDLGRRYRAKVFPCTPFSLQSSNGVLVVDRCVKLPFPRLPETVCVSMLLRTPPLCSALVAFRRNSV